MTGSAPIRSIAGDDKLVFEFFVMFSRFECGLIRAGFVRKGSSYGSAAPDWKAFSKAISSHLASCSDGPYTKAKDFLLKNPPQQQKFVAPASMKWEPNAKGGKETDAQYLLRLVRDVRNNLFHGGKYPAGNGGPIDGEMLRNAELLKAGMAILQACLSFHDKVKDHYDEAQ